MRHELKKLLKKSHAPITGVKIACCIKNKKNKYFGYNIESRKKMLHAEENALSRVPKNFRFDEIHLIANGKLQDIKNAIPCEKCSGLLSKYAKNNSKVIFYFNKGNKKFVLNFNKVKKLHSPFKDFTKLKKYPIDIFLKEKTFLTKIDRELLINIYNFILDYNSENNNSIALYLTGSSSKKGGPKSLLAKKITGIPYWDIDLIIIFKKRVPDNAVFFIENIYREAIEGLGFNCKKILHKNKSPYKKARFSNNNFRKIYYTKWMQKEIALNNYKKNIKIPSIIDVSFGISLKDVITNDYYNKNWYTQLISH